MVKPVKARVVRMPQLNIPAKVVRRDNGGYIMIAIDDIVKLIERRLARKVRDAKYTVHVVEGYIVVEVYSA